MESEGTTLFLSKIGGGDYPRPQESIMESVIKDATLVE